MKHVNWRERLLISVFIIISQEQIKQGYSKKGPGLTFIYIAGLSNWELLATIKKGKPGSCQGLLPEPCAFVIQQKGFGKV